jgi:hypothetical protein
MPKEEAKEVKEGLEVKKKQKNRRAHHPQKLTRIFCQRQFTASVPQSNLQKRCGSFGPKINQ